MKRLALLLALAGCATQPSPDAAVFAAEGAYTASSQAAAAYTHRPDADPITVTQLRALDGHAYALLVPLRTDAQAKRTIDPVAEDHLVSAVKALSDYETAHGIK